MARLEVLNSVPRRLVLASGIALIAILIVATTVVLAVLRDEALERAGWHLENLAAVMGRQMHQSVQSLDLIIGITVKDLEARIAGSRRFSDPELLGDMRERVLALPHVRNLVVLDAAGRIGINTQGTASTLEYADRDYFRAHRERRLDALYVGEPVVSRITGETVQTFSRAVRGPRGTLRSVVTGTVTPAHFANLFGNPDLGEGGHMYLFREDGVLLMAHPPLADAAAREFARGALFGPASQSTPRGRLRGKGPGGAEPAILAFERLQDYPLVLVVFSTESSILGAWRRDAWRIGAGAAGAAILMAITLYFLMRQLYRTSGLEHDLLESSERLRGIIQSAMDAVITVDGRQRIVLFNAAAEAIFRCPAAQAIGLPLERFIPERFRAAHHAHIEAFGATGATNRRMGLRHSLFGLRADGEEFPIDASISQVAVDGVHFYTVILRDITDRLAADVALERSNRELREASERLQAIVHSAMDAMVTIDEHHRIVLFNEAAQRIFLCKAEEAIGQPLDRFIPERFRAAHNGHIERFGETRVTTRMMGARLDLFGLRANGEEFPIDASISQANIEGRKLYTVILRDVTQRKSAEDAIRRSHEELRELSAAMHEVREAERLRIARELHDELAQWLTAIKMDVSWISARLPDGEAHIRDRAEKAKGLVDTTVSAVRRIAADLRPVMLDDLGVVPAVESLLHDLSQRTGIVVSLDVEADDLDLREPLATALYRMAQEALTNVARHAGATEVRVTIRQMGDDLVLRVLDNGRGFDAETPGRRKSYGVLGIQERAHTLGGRARFAPGERGGTLVEIVIPVARYRKQGEAR